MLEFSPYDEQDAIDALEKIVCAAEGEAEARGYARGLREAAATASDNDRCTAPAWMCSGCCNLLARDIARAIEALANAAEAKGRK